MDNYYVFNYVKENIMPYITQEKRAVLDPHIVKLCDSLSADKGEYNYAITCLLHHYISKTGLRYANLNDAMGIMDCAAKEFYRVVVGPYEDLKRDANEPISALDAVPTKLNATKHTK
jgi:hypothetical protein